MLNDADPVRGKALASLREARLMTQAGLAGAARLHVSTVKKLEAGRPTTPETAAAVCAVLGVAPGAFVAPLWGVPGDAVGATTGGDGAATPVPVAAPIPAPSREKGVPVVALVLLAAAAACEAAAWPAPTDGATDPFVLWQAGAQALLASAAMAWAWTWRWSGGRRGRTMARAAVVAGLLLVAWQPVKVMASARGTADDLVRMFRAYSRLNTLIHVRAGMEPGWDPAVARWSAIRWLQKGLGADDPWTATPGTYRWHSARGEACRRSFEEDPRYDPDCVRPPARRSFDRSWDALWRSVVGGPMDDPTRVDLDGHATEGIDVLSDPGFAQARALVAGATDGAGVMDQGKVEASLRAWKTAHAGDATTRQERGER